MDAEELKEQREKEMIEEIRARVEREFADQFENRFNVLESQLKEKEAMAAEARALLDKLQNNQQPTVIKPGPAQIDPPKEPQPTSAELDALRSSAQSELARLEALLNAERESRQEQERK